MREIIIQGKGTSPFYAFRTGKEKHYVNCLELEGGCNFLETIFFPLVLEMRQNSDKPKRYFYVRLYK